MSSADTADRGAVVVDLPDDWLVERDVEPFALFARPRHWAGDFVPNLLVTITPDEGPSPGSLAVGQRLALAATLDGWRLIDAVHDEAGATLLFEHVVDGRSLTCLQRHVIAAGLVLSASATAASDDWPTVGSGMAAAAGSIRSNAA